MFSRSVSVEQPHVLAEASGERLQHLGVDLRDSVAVVKLFVVSFDRGLHVLEGHLRPGVTGRTDDRNLRHLLVSGHRQSVCDGPGNKVRNRNRLADPLEITAVPAVQETDPEGVDFGWVMQVTFVATILVGSPIVAVAAIWTTLPTWTARAMFAVRVGAVVWFLTASCVYLYARYRR